MKTRQTEIENYVKETFDFLKRNIEYSDKLNTPLPFDSGSFGEILSCLMFGAKGSGTQGGASFDNDAGDEIKTLCYFQSKKCNKCGWKNSFFSKKCHSCDSKDFTYANDTRAGIDTKAHSDYYEQLNKYVIFEVIPTSFDSECRKFLLKASVIKKDNPFFNSLLNVQKNNSTSGHKNLLTSSVEYKMSAPAKVLEMSIDVSGDTTIVETVFQSLNYEYSENNVEKININEFQRQYKSFKNLIPRKTYDPCNNILNLMALPGSHGKKRGTVKRTNIKGAI